jgi:sterol desaturase/sphingolipid hydroxylase (fatty acid hydroxylase superfamily)
VFIISFFLFLFLFLGVLLTRRYKALQYLVHRHLLHPPYATTLSRLHHTWSHSLPPTPITPHYDHPLPYLLTRFLPAYFPFIILRPHLITYLLFLTAISLLEAISLSGLQGLPWGLDSMSRRCEAHWLGGGRRSFADLGLADWIAGTGMRVRSSEGKKRANEAL